jgi:Holliday junction resolvasome RuvABC endonuclease subunit
MFNIIGVDPGTNYCGVAVLTLNDNFDIVKIKPILIDLSTARYNLKNDLFKRLNNLYATAFDIFNVHKPIALAIEAGFINRLRPAAYGPISKSIYAVEKAFFDSTGLTNITEYPPSVVKQYIHGNWIADKEQMKEAVLKMFPYLPDDLTEHEYDAIAIGTTKTIQIKNRPETLLF